jgi:hypothetical protein
VREGRLSHLGFPAVALGRPRSRGCHPCHLAPLAVVHFFLFCNVFRIHRTKELVWAAICVVNVSTWAALDAFCWFGILAVQLPVTVAVIVLEMRGPWYHGVMARRINARLDDYLMGRL